MTDGKKTWIVEAATRGRAWCEVEAETKEEAINVALVTGEWSHDDWDINTAGYLGGSIDAREA